MRPDRDTVPPSKSDGYIHRVRIASVKSAGNVSGGQEWHERLVVETLADVTVEIDGHGVPSILYINAAGPHSVDVVVDRRRFRYPARPSAPVHEVFAVVLLGQIPVMGATHHLYIVRVVVAAAAKRLACGVTPAPRTPCNVFPVRSQRRIDPHRAPAPHA